MEAHSSGADFHRGICGAWKHSGKDGMARDYQAKVNGCWLPEHVYRRALALVRAYPEMAREAEGKDRRDKIQNITLRHELDAVERALDEIPTEYQNGVWDNLLERVPMDRLDYAARSTWSRWRGRFLWAVARNMHWI